MGAKRKLHVIGDLRGGQNSADPPLAVPENQCVAALNVDWFDGTVARKRGGAAAVTMGSVFTGTISHLSRFVPGADETAAKFVGVDSAATPVLAWMSAGTTWAAITPDDAIATKPQDFVAVTFNSKQFHFYDSTVDRLHYLDSSGVHHRVGLPQPTAPTVANTGAGAYAATARTYKIAWVKRSGSTVLLRSELSSSVSFTPSGAGTAARVTRPSLPGEDETDWELYGAATTGDTTYKLLSTIAAATSTYDDSTAPASYSGDAPPDSGENTVPVSAKYGLTDGNRLLMAGSWESGGKNNRVWFTPVLGSSNVGDDERVPTNNYQDFNENDGDVITGLGGPMQGFVYVFKYRQVWQMVPTGRSTAPYRVLNLTKSVGAIRHQSIVLAEDHNGNPALYFLSHKGPYRLGQNGLEYLGQDIKDLWQTVNLAATTVTCHGVHHADKHQIWWWVATGSNNEPDTKLVLDTELLQWKEDGTRGGWSKHTGNSASARCSAMFSNTLGATMSRDLKPYIGQHGAVNRVWKCDTSDTSDAGTNFQAYIETAPKPLGGLSSNVRVDEPMLLAEAQSGTTLTVTMISDFGLISDRTSTALLTASGSETRVWKKCEAGAQAGVNYVAFRIGDAAAAATGSWVIDRLVVPYVAEEAD